jgi:hypothetical protein
MSRDLALATLSGEVAGVDDESPTTIRAARPVEPSYPKVEFQAIMMLAPPLRFALSITVSARPSRSWAFCETVRIHLAAQ